MTNIYVGPIHNIKGRNGFGLYPVLVVKFKKVNKKGTLTFKLWIRQQFNKILALRGFKTISNEKHNIVKRDEK